MIRKWHICIRLDCDPNWSKDQVTQAFSGMEALEVELWEASFGGAGMKVLEGFWDVRGVGKAKVSGMVRPRMARWLEGVMESSIGKEVENWEENEGGEKWNARDNGPR